MADGRQIVETARKEAINYKQQFDRPIPIKVLNDRISSFIHAYTLYSAVRPFGVTIILASYSEETGPQMYMIEPSGSSYVSSNNLLSRILVVKVFMNRVIVVAPPVRLSKQQKRKLKS